MGTETKLTEQFKGPGKPRLKLVSVTCDTDESIINQLFGPDRDRVHELGVGSREEIKDYRIPKDTSSNRRCWCAIDDQGIVHAVLYGHLDSRPLNGDESNLAGDVTEILKNKQKPLLKTPESAIFYSISSLLSGTGAAQFLIESVYKEFNKPQESRDLLTYPPVEMLSTLSPCRQFDFYLLNPLRRETILEMSSKERREWLKGLENSLLESCETEGGLAKIDEVIGRFSRMEDQEKLEAVIDFLTVDGGDVHKFHMRNGAYVGGIKFNAKDPKSFADVMINYVYPSPEEIEINKASFAAGIVTVAKRLMGISKQTNLRALGDISVSGPSPALVPN